MKPHKINALFLLGGLIIGAVLHYTFQSKIVVQKSNEAFEMGLQQGKDDMIKDIIVNFNEADSVYISSEEIKFISFNKKIIEK